MSNDKNKTTAGGKNNYLNKPCLVFVTISDFSKLLKKKEKTSMLSMFSVFIYDTVLQNENQNFQFSVCKCYINGKIYNYGETIYETTDGLGNCITAVCGENDIIKRNVTVCPTTTAPSPTTTHFVFSTIGPTSGCKC